MKGMALNQMANRREQVLFGAVALVLVFFFFKIVHTPQASEINILKSRVLGLQIEKEALAKFLAETPTIEAAVTLSRSKRGGKTKILTGEIQSPYKDVASLFARVTEPEFLGGITIYKLSYAQPTKVEGYSQTDFTLNVAGSFTDIVNYLEKLEQFPALFSLEGIGIQRAEGQVLELEASISGRFFQLDGREKLGGNS